MKKITRADLKKSKSSLAMFKRGVATKQLTENCTTFENMLGIEGIDVHLALFFKDKAPVNFDVTKWFKDKDYEHKLVFSNLMKKAILSRSATTSNVCTRKTIIRLLTSDIYEGEDQNIISYLFEIEYNPVEILKAIRTAPKKYDLMLVKRLLHMYDNKLKKLSKMM